MYWLEKGKLKAAKSDRERDCSIVGKSNMGKMSVIKVITTEYALLTVIIIVCLMLCNACTTELDIV